MSPTLVAIGTITLIGIAVGLMLWRIFGGAAVGRRRVRSGRSTRTGVSREFPAAGLLVPEEVLRFTGSGADSIWGALEAAAVPVALEYYPVSALEISRLHAVPVNASAQQAAVDLIKKLNPKGPTLFRAVLPEGAELVKAVGDSGFRGFSRTGGKTAHAVLKPVAIGSAAAAGWPVFAVAATVTAMDMVSQRELRAHQRRVESVLGHQEERHYIERISNQRSADAQLTRAISLMLDGQHPSLELARKSADDEFYVSVQFLQKYRGVIETVVEADGKVDCRRLEEVLGGKEKDIESFIRDLHLARGAIAIQRKAIVADAAGRSLSDPTNPYVALRRLLDEQVRELEDAEAAETALTRALSNVELKGRWHDELLGRWYDSDKTAMARQARLRALVTPATADDDAEIRYLWTASGEVLRVLPSDDESHELPAAE